MLEPIKERVAELGSQMGRREESRGWKQGRPVCSGRTGYMGTGAGGGIPTFCCIPFGPLEFEPCMF